MSIAEFSYLLLTPILSVILIMAGVVIFRQNKEIEELKKGKR